MIVFRTILAAALVLTPSFARADASPSPTPTATLAPFPTSAEKAFVDKAMHELAAKYPKAADAETAGFVRYTDEDKSGSISYANRDWTSVDVDHPSQLWYDVNGRLLGADYSVPYSDARPTTFGIEPGRWEEFHAHVHYGVIAPGGLIYGGTGGKKFTSAGGDVANPTPQQLVAAGLAKKAEDVAFVFAFPHIWDLEVWVLPNANGAFATLNPSVKPVHPAADE